MFICSLDWKRYWTVYIFIIANYFASAWKSRRDIGSYFPEGNLLKQWEAVSQWTKEGKKKKRLTSGIIAASSKCKTDSGLWCFQFLTCDSIGMSLPSQCSCVVWFNIIIIQCFIVCCVEFIYLFMLLSDFLCFFSSDSFPFLTWGGFASHSLPV